MNREGSPKFCWGPIPEKRSKKLAVLRKATREGTYKVKAEDIAEKMILRRLFELALTA